MSLDITCTDMFCGAGGSSSGAVQAGIIVKLALNHWKRAIETHNLNHPQTMHALTDLFVADPRHFPRTTILICSPSCTSHSLAKGKQRKNISDPTLPWEDQETDLSSEAEERSRCTMWTPLEWAEHHRYEAVIVENVVDVVNWGPFHAWLAAWKGLDYEIVPVCLNSMFVHPTPQSRDRVYFVATKRKNKQPNLKITPLAYCQSCLQQVQSVQSWKNPTKRYGKYRQQYVYRCPHCAKEVLPFYYAAANAINWSLPTERIGDRKRPLQPKTMERISYGLEKFARPFYTQVNKSDYRAEDVMEHPFPTQTGTNGLAMVLPYLLNLSHSAHPQSYVHSPYDSPIPTQTTRDDLALIAPYLFSMNHTSPQYRNVVEEPFSTQTTYDDTAFVMPFIAELHGTSTARPVTEALATVCTSGSHHGLVAPPFLLDHLAEYRTRSITGPCSTVCASGNHHSIVVPPILRSWLMTYYNNGAVVETTEPVPTCTTIERHALLIHDAEKNIRVEDCGFRMLTPDEIKRAMAFPDDYIITGTRREQVKQLGNAVTAPVMKLLIERIVDAIS